jgi:hypothetical protein
MSARRLVWVVLAAMAAPLPAMAEPHASGVVVPGLPVPPQPLDTLRDYAPAPVPNVDLDRPLADQRAERPRTEVSPSLFNERARRNGNGYLPGSAAQYDPNESRGFRPTPGINLRVPLQ